MCKSESGAGREKPSSEPRVLEPNPQKKFEKRRRFFQITILAFKSSREGSWTLLTLTYQPINQTHARASSPPPAHPRTTTPRPKKRRRVREMREQEACPVCMEPLREDGDDSIRCLSRHRTCLSCAGKMVKPCGECKPATCTGLWFTCPLCTRRSALEPPFLLAILQGSWLKSHRLHGTDAQQRLWLAKCLTLSHGSPDALEWSVRREGQN